MCVFVRVPARSSGTDVVRVSVLTYVYACMKGEDSKEIVNIRYSYREGNDYGGKCPYEMWAFHCSVVFAVAIFPGERGKIYY